MPSPSADHRVLSAVGTRTILNLLCKLLFRFLHFFLNGLILRQIDVNIIGIANVRLQLLYTTILFLSREAFRRTVPKLADLRSTQHYINLVWLILPTGLLLILLALPVTLYFQTDHAETFPFYYQACAFYALAAFIELLSEPLYLLATVKLNYHVNIYIEMFASTVGFTIQAFLVYSHPNSALYYYGLGYILYSSLITATYYLFFLTRTFTERKRLFLIGRFADLLIKPTTPFVDQHLSHETYTFFKQGIWMKILTEGERYLMSLFNLISYKEQGIFDVINNIGSLLPRLIFATLEESAYAYFQQTLSRTKANTDQHIQDDQFLVRQRHTPAGNETEQTSSPTQQQTNMWNALTLYNHLLHFVLIVSFLVLTFGIPYSEFALHLYGGANLSSGPGPRLLQFYCIYILFLAVNGISEAFSQATMSIKQLENYKNLISIFALLYLLIFYLSIQSFGIYGIILSNCLNMSARIITNSYYIHRYFHGVQFFRPFHFSVRYLLSLISCFALCLLSRRWLTNSFLHFSFGGVLGLGMLALTWREEKEMIHYIYCIVRLNRER